MAEPSLPSRLIIRLVRFYQRRISPRIGPRCRFYPTCSAYMIEAVRKRGFMLGTLKGVWRIVKCNPLHPGGYDPVEKDSPR